MIEGQDLQSGRKARSWGHTTIGVGTQFKHLHQELGPLLIVTKKFMPVLQDERDWKPKQRRFFFAVSTVTHYRLWRGSGQWRTRQEIGDGVICIQMLKSVTILCCSQIQESPVFFQGRFSSNWNQKVKNWPSSTFTLDGEMDVLCIVSWFLSAVSNSLPWILA